MKKLFAGLTLLLAIVVCGQQNILQTVQPGCWYDCYGKKYRGADSTYRPTYHNGNTVPVCRGIKVKDGTDTGTIMVQPAYNTLETRYPIKIGPGDIGYERSGCVWSYIYRSGTTIPLDSLWIAPDIGK